MDYVLVNNLKMPMIGRRLLIRKLYFNSIAKIILSILTIKLEPIK